MEEECAAVENEVESEENDGDDCGKEDAVVLERSEGAEVRGLLRDRHSNKIVNIKKPQFNVL